MIVLGAQLTIKWRKKCGGGGPGMGGLFYDA